MRIQMTMIVRRFDSLMCLLFVFPPHHFHSQNYSENFDHVITLYNPRTVFYILAINDSSQFPYVRSNTEVPAYYVNLRSFHSSSLVRAVVDTGDELIVVMIEHVTDFLEIFSKLRTFRWWKARNRLLVIHMDETSNFTTIFKFCHEFNTINIAFVHHPTYEAYTYNPFSGNYNEKIQFPNLFPDKTSNLYGHMMKISLYDNVMNAIPDRKFGYVGRDGEMARTLMDRMNATYSYFPLRGDGMIKSLSDVQLDQLFEGAVDVAFTTRLLNYSKFEGFAESTYPHDKNDLTCLVPRNGLKAIDGFFRIFGTFIWLQIVLIASLFFLLLLMMKRQRNDRCELFLMTLLILINQHVNESRVTGRKSGNQIRRLIFLGYVVFSLIINALVLCGLTTYFTTSQYHTEIDRLTELAQSDYDLVMLPRFRDMLRSNLKGYGNLATRLELMPEPGNKEISFIFGSVLEEAMQLDEIAKCDERTVVIVENSLAVYAVTQKENYPNDRQFYRIMREKIMPAIACYVVANGSPYLKRFDRLIARIIEAGLQDYWIATSWHKLSLGSHYISTKYCVKYPTFRYTRPLDLSVVWHGFYVLFAGFTLAFGVFLMEYFVLL